MVRVPAGPQVSLSGEVRIAALRGGQRAWTLPLPHGWDPQTLLRAQRMRALGLPRVTRDPDGLVLAYEVTDAAEPGRDAVEADGGSGGLPSGHPAVLPPPPSLGVDPDAPAAQVQRVTAHVLVWSERGLLATRFSERTRVAGLWGLPGGGVDPGEEPVQAALRECWEETGQQVRLGELLRVGSRHWRGRSPHGRVEDFHAVGLVYAGSCDAPGEPVVHDVGGTTQLACWVPGGQVAHLPWADGHAWVASTPVPRDAG